MTLEEKVIQTLQEEGFQMATAESCTGGLLAGRLLNVPGASEVFREGYITYSNEAKERILGVSADTLEQYGAVSTQTAQEMLLGVLRQNPAVQVAVSTTGIAGPGGGTKEKPVGLIYVACLVLGELRVKELHLKGNREENRQESVEQALKLLLECL